ncbi:hypothetical protein JCM18899A_31770 [Nocardioides sp. AN3]
MHTARQLAADQFTVEIAGAPATREELFVEMGPLHRLGVVIHDPFGIVGASYILQLAISAYYDARPTRRSREHPTYPDVYAFHVGGRHGDLSAYDVFPSRKEVFVENDPVQILGALNDRGITHLVVPDRPVGEVQHLFKEPEQARDRMVAAWAYSPDGRTADADVAITGLDRLVEVNTKMCLQHDDAGAERLEAQAMRGELYVPEGEVAHFPPLRLEEVPEADRNRIWKGRENLRTATGWTETYRRIDVSDAIRMLHRGNAPALAESSV